LLRPPHKTWKLVENPCVSSNPQTQKYILCLCFLARCYNSRTSSAWFRSYVFRVFEFVTSMYKKNSTVVFSSNVISHAIAYCHICTQKKTIKLQKASLIRAYMVEYNRGLRTMALGMVSKFLIVHTPFTSMTICLVLCVSNLYIIIII